LHDKKSTDENVREGACGRSLRGKSRQIIITPHNGGDREIQANARPAAGGVLKGRARS
jgi:hypothetical protein